MSVEVCGAVIMVGLILTVIIVPLSFSYLDYDNYGLRQRKRTGKVSVDRVYTRGRYNTGPGYTFVKYKADAHFYKIKDLAVFSSGTSGDSIGLTFTIDAFISYLLIQDELGELYKDSGFEYEAIIESRAIEAIRNIAIGIPFNDYFRNRDSVEDRFKTAIESRWKTPPSVHANLDKFYLQQVSIPESVALRQLESRVQNERNDMEGFVQQARIERKQAEIEANRLTLQADKLLSTTMAEADLKVANARTQALQITRTALNNGTQTVLEAVGIESQKEKVTYMYLQALTDHKQLLMEVHYMDDENLVKVSST